jgi:hypothetical protein
MNHAAIARTRSITSPSGITLGVMCLVLALRRERMCLTPAPRHAADERATERWLELCRPRLDAREGGRRRARPVAAIQRQDVRFRPPPRQVRAEAVAQGWKAVVPERTEIMMSNAFENITVVPRVLNNALQAQWDGAGRELSRVLSFMDPLTVRDGVGRFVESVLPLLPVRFSLMAGTRVNERALSDDLLQEFDDSVLHPYSAVRNAYLQCRAHIIHEQEEHP